MPPSIATALTVLGVLFLMTREVRHAEARSAALWLPVLWLGITGSRFVSQWIDLGAPTTNVEEGSFIDALYFSTLIAAAFYALAKRGLTLSDVVRDNLWLVALLAYSFLSVLWSDEPTVAAKRWIKTLGHPLMALIILSDPRPAEALRTVVRRCAIFLLPVSVLFIKYLPDLGRGFDAWSGEATNNGVGLTKNDLGYVCMVTGIVFVWDWLTVGRIAAPKQRRAERLFIAGALATAGWLLLTSQSTTSLLATALGIATLVGLGHSLVPKRYFAAFVICVAVVATIVESTFSLYEVIVTALGKSPTLTDRTVIWADVLAMQEQPLIGYGFESFWLGYRLDLLWDKWWWRPIQAHNGYIETYLNLGLIGVALLAAVLLSTFVRISRQLQTDFEFARLRMALLFAILLFNYAEAAFKGVHFVWTIFFIVAMEYRPVRDASWTSEQSIAEDTSPSHARS